MKKKLIATLAIACAVAQISFAQTVKLASPDGRTVSVWEARDGRLTLTVTKDARTVIDRSELVITEGGDCLTQSCTMGRPEFYSTDSTYPTRGTHSIACDRANGMKVTLRRKSQELAVLEARIQDDGVAFRFLISGDGKGGRIVDEASCIRLVPGCTVWYHDMMGFYEGIHDRKDISAVKKGEWAAPPLTFQLTDGGYGCITEAAIADYAGMALQADGSNGFVTRLGHAQPSSTPFSHDYSLEEAIRLGEPAELSGDVRTPWRCVILADDLNTLVNTDLITNLSPEPDKELFPDGLNTSWIRPGRSVWCWVDGGDRNIEGMKEFSRLASEIGFEYNTVDAFWYRWTDEQIKDLVDYSKALGVDIWLWRHGRDLRDPQKMEEFFARCERLGVVGAKLDALSHESKEFMDLYQRCLRCAAKHHVMLNMHGSNKPSGEVRTWPNEMSREGIRGMEYAKHVTSWATHNNTLPYTRFVAGAGDYTPMIFGEKRKETTWMHQIATALIFNSSVIFFASHPQAILDNPGLDLIKTIPSVWDETIVLPDSRIGERTVWARRSGDTWYVAALNGQEADNVAVPLDFLPEGWFEARIWQDGDTEPSIRKHHLFVRSSDALTAPLKPAGGWVLKLTPVKR